MGVTAWTVDEALRLITERLRGEKPEPIRIVEDPDLSDLWPGSLEVASGRGYGARR